MYREYDLCMNEQCLRKDKCLRYILHLESMDDMHVDDKYKWYGDFHGDNCFSEYAIRNTSTPEVLSSKNSTAEVN